MHPRAPKLACPRRERFIRVSKLHHRTRNGLGRVQRHVRTTRRVFKQGCVRLVLLFSNPALTAELTRRFDSLKQSLPQHHAKTSCSSRLRTSVLTTRRLGQPAQAATRSRSNASSSKTDNADRATRKYDIVVLWPPKPSRQPSHLFLSSVSSFAFLRLVASISIIVVCISEGSILVVHGVIGWYIEGGFARSSGYKQGGNRLNRVDMTLKSVQHSKETNTERPCLPLGAGLSRSYLPDQTLIRRPPVRCGQRRLQQASQPVLARTVRRPAPSSSQTWPPTAPSCCRRP